MPTLEDLPEEPSFALIEEALGEHLPEYLVEMALGYAVDAVHAVLRIDTRHRVPGITGGLRQVADLHPDRDPYRGPLPTLLSPPGCAMRATFMSTWTTPGKANATPQAISKPTANFPT